MATTGDNSPLQEQWMRATDSGDLERVRALLAAHPELLNARVDHPTLRGVAGLHLSAWRNCAAVAELLLDAGADIELPDETGMTPLQVDVLRVSLEKMRSVPLLRSQCLDVRSPVAVCMARFKRKLTRDRSTYRDIDTSTLDLLLSRGADVNSYCGIGDSVLLLATEYGLIKHVEKLLAHGADTSVQDKNGRSALDVAAEHGYMDVLQLLLAEGPPDSVARFGERALRMAIRHDHADALDLLFDRFLATLPADRSQLALKGELLLLGVEYDTPDCVRFLLDRGAPVDWTAAGGDAKDGAKDDGADADARTSVHLACTYGRPEILRMLLARGADSARRLPGSGFSPYHSAVAHIGYDEIAVLGRHGADINLLDKEQQSPLVLAARRRCSFPMMRALVQFGGRFVLPSVASRDEMAPMLAAWTHDVRPAAVPALVEAVLNCGCIGNANHRRLLSALVWSGHTEEAVLLMLLMLFSPNIGPAQQAARVVELWAIEFGADVVVRALMMDALHAPRS